MQWIIRHYFWITLCQQIRKTRNRQLSDIPNLPNLNYKYIEIFNRQISIEFELVVKVPPRKIQHWKYETLKEELTYYPPTIMKNWKGATPSTRVALPFYENETKGQQKEKTIGHIAKEHRP
jgi:hypothetical protein